jgi:hypothetical protein
MTNRKEKLEIAKEIMNWYNWQVLTLAYLDWELEKCQENKEEHKCKLFQAIWDTTKYYWCIQCWKPEEPKEQFPGFLCRRCRKPYLPTLWRTPHDFCWKCAEEDNELEELIDTLAAKLDWRFERDRHWHEDLIEALRLITKKLNNG